MLEAVQDRLLKAKQRLRRKRKIDSMLRDAERGLDQERRKCNRHDQVLAKEQADVEKLEGTSLSGLFYSLLGTREERLEAEKQEYLAAKLKYDESQVAIDEYQRDVDRLHSQLCELSNAEIEYQRLFDEKSHLLADAGDEQAGRITEFSERLAELETDQEELQEAVQAGETAERSLESVRCELRSAENWGTWDMMGGGTLSTWAKHSRIDSAKQHAQVAQRDLRRFRQELADADQRLQVSLGDIDGFSTFADYFFDGLIADWIVQTKVRKASQACDSAIR